MSDSAWSNIELERKESSQKGWLVPEWKLSTKETIVEFDGFSASFSPPSRRIYGQINRAARLEPGDLVFNVQPDNICYSFSRRTRKFTYVFEAAWGPGTLLWCTCPDSNGNIYASMSGMRTSPPIVEADFGNWGGIFVVTPRNEVMRTLSERDPIVDPYGLQLLPDGRLLVADFSGFGGTGRVYTLNPLNGHTEVIASGNNLVDPVSAYVDDQGVLWIANADLDAVDGEILSVDLNSGATRVVFPRRGEMSGALSGVFAAHESEYVLAASNDWPDRVNTSVFLVEKESGSPTTILQADEANPLNVSNIGAVVGDKLWIAECVNRELLEIELPSGKVTDRVDLTPIMGGHCGMRHSFDAISAIYAVPA